MTDPRPKRCLYQCADHHGPWVHGPDCPVDMTRKCCRRCAEDIQAGEMRADPYLNGDYATMFGDDE